MRNKISILFLVLCILLGIGAGYCFSTTKPKKNVPTVGTTKPKENVPITGTTKLEENVPITGTTKPKESVPTVGTTELKENVQTAGTENETREVCTVPQTGKDEKQKDFIATLFVCDISFLSICACIRYKLNQMHRSML